MKWACLLALAACHDETPAATRTLDHSSSIVIDGDRLYVANPDADSISVIDLAARSLVAEIHLDAMAMPRALALSGATLYATGERTGMLYAIDTTSQVVRSVAVGSEPIGIAVSTDTVYVACSQDASIAMVDPATLAVTGHIPVAAEPWALGWAQDGVLVATHFLGAQLSEIDASHAVATVSIPETAPRGDRRLAHGPARGLYDVAARPNSDELWVAHVRLGTDTAQPDLDFESTVFPALSIIDGASGYRATLSTDAADIPGIDGALGDVVSGPHAIAFTSDGAYALVVDTNSEDILAIDATTDLEAALLRPLPGHMPEGIALSADEQTAYIDERNTGDIAIVHIDRSNGIALSVEGTIPRLANDPMSPQQRRGQHLFFSANSDEVAITQNHWVACASCHLEGRSDAVTWRFVQGPRDTPTNAGGMLGTGFLFRTADRTTVQDYWRTIDTEQGGAFDPVADAARLDDIAAFVNLGLPAPMPPTTDPALVAAGKAVFERAEVGCATCHGGPRFTDSGAGNTSLALAVLHDVGTCAAGDVAHLDILGDPRAACAFDTPSLTGLASTAPYLHDGSAPTIRDVLEMTRGRMGDISSLTPDEESALVEFLRSL